MDIKINIGYVDQGLRFISSSLMLYFSFYHESAITSGLSGILLGSFGIIILLTAIFRNCPLYSMAGINTNKDKRIN